jgi:hypothetical protein
MYQPVWQETTSQNYTPQSSSTPSAGLEMDIGEILSELLINSARKKSFKIPISHKALMPLFEIDLSSVMPRIEVISETFEREAIESFPGEELEFNIIVRMPPLKRGTAKVRVKNVRKATPHVSEPEGIY